MIDTLEIHPGVSEGNEDVIFYQIAAFDGDEGTGVTMLLLLHTRCADDVVVGGLDVTAVT